MTAIRRCSRCRKPRDYPNSRYCRSCRGPKEEALTCERLKSLLEYAPEAGVFRWRHGVAGRGGARAGQVAGGITKRGYRHICIDQRFYYASRLAWLYMTGEWPKGTIDHKNLKVDDNRWVNLRVATQSQQNANRHALVTNSSGFKGVRRRLQRWCASISKNRKIHHLGYFDTAEEAHAAYCTAAERFHGEFARAA